jgi:hypothetical protein
MNATPTTERIRRLRSIARLLDESIPLPGGYRIGLDPIIGLIPGFGDALGALFALFVVAEARRVGASKSVLTRMLGNVFVDAIVGSIPLVGDLFDAAYKANMRNVDLLERFHADPNAVHRSSRRRVVAVSMLLLMMLLTVFALPIVIVIAIVNLF